MWVQAGCPDAASCSTKCLREGRLIAKAHASGNRVQLECRIGEQRLDEFPEDRILNRTKGRLLGFKSALQTSLAHPQPSRHDGTVRAHPGGQEGSGGLPNPILQRCEWRSLGRKSRRQLRQLIGDQGIAEP